MLWGCSADTHLFVLVRYFPEWKIIECEELLKLQVPPAQPAAFKRLRALFKLLGGKPRYLIREDLDAVDTRLAKAFSSVSIEEVTDLSCLSSYLTHISSFFFWSVSLSLCLCLSVCLLIA
jgi:hypothetical protein